MNGSRNEDCNKIYIYDIHELYKREPLLEAFTALQSAY